MAKLAKRRRWRPRDANGKVIHGGAGGFHRVQSLEPRKEPMPERKP